MVFGEQFLEVITTGGLHAQHLLAAGLLAAFSTTGNLNGSAGHEGFVDLVVQVFTIGEDEKRPIPRDLAQDLLAEES